MKKKLPFMVATVALFALAGCGSKPETKTDWTVGICQLVTHDALDAATKGFKDALVEKLGAEHVKFDEQNAAGQLDVCTTIANSFVSKKVDLIMANATPALQAAANATLSIPILGTSVTDYGVALGIKDFDGIVGGNISGTSDCAPLTQQAQMIIDVFPQASKVGLLYCSAEANSLYQVKVVEEFLKGKGLTTARYPFTDSNDISAITTNAASNSDVIYVPTDNTAASNAEIINTVCTGKNVPVVAGEEGLCKDCGTITLSISYYNLGLKTGKMAAEILKEGKDISKMAIAYDENPVKEYNKAKCEALGITVPSDYVVIKGTEA